MKTLLVRALFVSLMLSQVAFAHLMPAQQGSINIQGASAFVAVALPVSALKEGDYDGNGKLSPSEASRYQSAIAQQIGENIRLFDGAQAGKIDFMQINAESEDKHSQEYVGNTQDGAHFFLVLIKYSFTSAPQALEIRANFFGKRAGEQQLTIKAIRGEEQEVVILRPDHLQHSFFRGPRQVLVDFINTGLHHILTGWDHLAFLLTIIAVAATWRHILLVTTVFTLAHSASFMLSLMGLIPIAAQWFEPAIAASIVFMAGLNLIKRELPSNLRLLAVFSCGLLHGLGFASSISDMGVTNQNRWWSLLGFNLGIELGQLVFICFCLSVFWLLKRLTNEGTKAPLYYRGANALALVVGVYFLTQF